MTQRRADWIALREAVERVLSHIDPLERETVALERAVGRVLARDVTSPTDQPPWDNSAMDGFAVRSVDVRGATADRPVVLRVIERVPAGGFPTAEITEGTAVRIMTGAPLPKGADGVIRIEHTEERAADHVAVLDDADAGRNVRFRGEDLKRDGVVLRAGRLLRPGEIGVLATVGCAQVPVYRKPLVAILSTGDELADITDLDAIRTGRKIANSNSYALAAAVRNTGAEPRMLGIARDDAASLRAHLERAAGADILVTTAGASVGDHDLVKDALEEIGFELDFWRVRIRPGSPFSFGRLRSGVPVFGLPGNPVSALVTFEIFVRPAIRRMMGRADVHSPLVRVRVDGDAPSKGGLVHFLRVRLHTAADGVVHARLTGAQGSGIISSMAEADALLIVPEDRDGLRDGEWAWAVRLVGADEATPQFWV